MSKKTISAERYGGMAVAIKFWTTRAPFIVGFLIPSNDT